MKFGGRANSAPDFVIVGAARSSHTLRYAPVRRPLHSSSCIEILRGLMPGRVRPPERSEAEGAGSGGFAGGGGAEPH